MKTVMNDVQHISRCNLSNGAFYLQKGCHKIHINRYKFFKNLNLESTNSKNLMLIFLSFAIVTNTFIFQVGNSLRKLFNEHLLNAVT